MVVVSVYEFEEILEVGSKAGWLESKLMNRKPSGVGFRPWDVIRVEKRPLARRVPLGGGGEVELSVIGDLCSLEMRERLLVEELVEKFDTFSTSQESAEPLCP